MHILSVPARGRVPGEQKVALSLPKVALSLPKVAQFLMFYTLRLIMLCVCPSSSNSTVLLELLAYHCISHISYYSSTMSDHTHVVFNNADNLPTPNSMWMKIGAPPCREKLVPACSGNTMGRADVHLFYSKVYE